MVYNTPRTYLPPTYFTGVATAATTATTATAATAPSTTLTVTVSFTQLPSKLVTADDRCKTEPPFKVPVAQCAWFSITGSDGVALNATVTIDGNGTALVLTAASSAAGVTAVSTAFGWNGWPINTIMTAEGLPLQPWTENVTSSSSW